MEKLNHPNLFTSEELAIHIVDTLVDRGLFDKTHFEEAMAMVKWELDAQQRMGRVQLSDGLAVEWEYYFRVVGRLLAEGNDGKWLLIKKEQIIGIWDTEEEAEAVRQERFASQPALAKQVLGGEEFIRVGYRYNMFRAESNSQ